MTEVGGGEKREDGMSVLGEKDETGRGRKKYINVRGKK